MAHYRPSEAALPFKCCYCDTANTEVQIVSHIVEHHVKPELAPWRCGLCGSQAIYRQALGNHVHHDQHVQEVKRRPGERCESIMAKNPYIVKVGIDYMTVTDEHPVKKSCPGSQKRKHSPPDTTTPQHIPTIDAKSKSKSRQVNVQTQTEKRDTAEVFEMNGRMLLDSTNALAAALPQIGSRPQIMIKRDNDMMLEMMLKQRKDPDLKNDIKGGCLQ